MASVERTAATYYTNQIGSNGDTRLKTSPSAQHYRVYRIRRDFDASELTTDTFKLFKLKVGQVVLPGQSWITHDSVAATSDIDIGDTTDVNRYADGLDLSAAGQTNFCDPAIPAGEDTPFAATAALSDVIVTVNTATTPAAGSVVFYLAVADASYSEE